MMFNSPQPMPIAAFDCARTPVACITKGSARLSFCRCHLAHHTQIVKTLLTLVGLATGRFLSGGAHDTHRSPGVNPRACMRAITKLIFQCLRFSQKGRLVAISVIIGGVSAKALVIVPAFDSSITSDPNAATIESTINTAIQFYEARFSDPITVTIDFEEITTAGLFGQSSWWYYNIPYSQYLTALQQDSSTTNDIIALAILPSGTSNPVTGTRNMRVKTANLRAIGITGLNSGISGGYDGVIGLHTSELNLSRVSINSSKGDLLATVEHEIDEVLGLGSALDANVRNPYPEDLFRYTSTGSRTFTTNFDNAYFSIDGANFPEQFNQNANYDHGDWWVAGTHTPQVQDAFATDGATPNPKTELIALDVIGYNLLRVPQPAITHISLSGTQLMLNGTNGLASANYCVLTSTNLSLPLLQWTSIATNTLGANGNFSFTVSDVVNPSEAKRFFALLLQL
jgi:hypothetical protein